MFILSSHLFSLFILSSCWIFLVVGIAGSMVESAWKSRWWGQLGTVDGVILEEVESLESSLQTAQMVDVEAFSDGNIKESSPDS